MTSVIILAEDELAAGWKWVRTEAGALYHAIAPLVADALKRFEQSVIEGLWGAAATLAQRLPRIAGLADLETALLNTLATLRGAFLAAAQALGSALLQSILGLLQARTRLAGA